MNDSINNARQERPREYNLPYEFVEPTSEEIYRRVIDYKTILKNRKSADIFSLTKESNACYVESFNKFMTESKSSVALLSNQFQQKKAAYQYSRSTVSRRGVIDVNALHKYKYAEDIFLSNTNLADAKSHGMVFMIDQSGSMSGERIGGVINQTLILVQFCKANSIPFSVYTWTDVHGQDASREDKKTAFSNKLTLTHTTVHEICSSDMSKSEFKLSMWQMFLIGRWGGVWSQARHFGDTTNYDAMGATPIGSTLLIASTLLVDLKKRWGVQVMNFMFLTDGVGEGVCKWMSAREDGEYFRQGCRHGDGYGKLNGHNVKFDSRSEYAVLIDHITNNLGVNTIGLFETSTFCANTGRMMSTKENKSDPDSSSYFFEKRQEVVDNMKKLKREFKKSSIVHASDVGGFDKFIMMNSSAGTCTTMQDDYNDNLKQLQKDFISQSNTKKTKKVFATEIIDTICANF